MSTTARTDTKLKKGKIPLECLLNQPLVFKPKYAFYFKKERFGKKQKDDGGKSSPTHSEVEEKLSFKAIDGEDIQALAIKEEDLKKVHY